MRPIWIDFVDVAVGMVVFFLLLTLGEKAIEVGAYIRAYIAALWKVYVKKPKRDISLGDSLTDIRAEKPSETPPSPRPTQGVWVGRAPEKAETM